MNDQFDKKLVDRISEVFDHFEDDSAVEGWQKLQPKLPERKRRVIAWWWLGSAAAVLIMAGIWLNMRDTSDTEIRTKNVAKQLKSDKGSDKAESLLATRNTKETSKLPQELSVPKARLKREVLNGGISHEKTALITALASGKPDINMVNIVAKEQTTTTIVVDPVEVDMAPITMATGNDVNENHTGLRAIEPDSRLAERKADLRQDDTGLSSQPQNAIPSTSSTLQEPDKASKRSASSKQKAVKLGLYAGSFMNYSQGSESDINTTVGLASEFRINKKLKFVTGISLGKNSISYDNVIPKDAALSFANSPANLDVNNQTSVSYSGNTMLNISSFDAKLTGLDIPLNLRYTIREDKTKIYLTTGFSSNIYIDESYTYSVNYRSIGSGKMTDTPGQQTTTKYNSVDFARVLNLSLGVNYPLSRRSTISFEPFLKHPLSGLGSQNLKFGAAGMNVIINFDNFK